MTNRIETASEATSFKEAFLSFAMDEDGIRAVGESAGREADDVFEPEIVEPAAFEVEEDWQSSSDRITRAEFESRMEHLDRQIEMMLACSRANIETAAALKATLDSIPRLAEAVQQHQGHHVEDPEAEPQGAPARAEEEAPAQGPAEPAREPAAQDAGSSGPSPDAAPQMPPQPEESPQPQPEPPVRAARGARASLGDFAAYAAAVLIAASGLVAAAWAAMELGWLP